MARAYRLHDCATRLVLAFRRDPEGLDKRLKRIEFKAHVYVRLAIEDQSEDGRDRALAYRAAFVHANRLLTDSRYRAYYL